MDDATQKLGTCPTCRHAEHEGYTCLNMASDYDCGCDKRPPKVDDATRKLVDDAREYASTGPVFARDYITRLADALEAAQRPPVAEPDNHHNADVCPFCTRNRDEREAAIRAEAIAQRPPVSPEAREAVKAVIAAEFSRVGLNIDGEPYAYQGDQRWPIALELRDRLTDALLARFSVPSQPVYDEEKIARLIFEATARDWGRDYLPRKTCQSAAAALIAALRGGELTREEKP